MADPATSSGVSPDPSPSPSPPRLSQPSLEAWGKGVGEAVRTGELRLPLVVALRGGLGAGKSVLARAIARGVGVTSPMPSPTYNLRFTYDLDGIAVHHLDLYRLEHPDDVWELGWEDLGVGRELVLIEWPERAESLLPGDRWDVRLGFSDDADDDDDADDADDDAPGPATDRAADRATSAAFRTLRVERCGDAPEPPPLPGASPLPGSSS